MTKASIDAVLGAAAKALAWELYSAAAYGRTHASVNVERFDREMLSAAKRWKATLNNLNKKRRKNNGKHHC